MLRHAEGHRVPRALRPRRLALLTDFGTGPYVGQMRLLLAGARRSVQVVDLISDLVPFRPDLAAYLLPGLLRGMPSHTLYLCVVDPGVGSDRGVLAARIGNNWLLAPDNGLLVPLLRSRSEAVELWRVRWRPPDMSASFHGRDLFVPIAQRLLSGRLPTAEPLSPEHAVGADMPASRQTVCYVDHFGNAITGVPASILSSATRLRINDVRIARARTFSDVPRGEPFWYKNAFGLVEIAVNQGRADAQLGLVPGDPLTFEP